MFLAPQNYRRKSSKTWVVWIAERPGLSVGKRRHFSHQVFPQLSTLQYNISITRSICNTMTYRTLGAAPSQYTFPSGAWLRACARRECFLLLRTIEENPAKRGLLYAVTKV